MSKKNRRDSAPLDYERKELPKPHAIALRSRPGPLIALSIIFAVWTVTLIVLYFTTVR